MLTISRKPHCTPSGPLPPCVYIYSKWERRETLSAKPQTALSTISVPAPISSDCNCDMASCFAPTPSSLFPNDRFLFQSPTRGRRTLPARKWRCSAAEQPQPQKSRRTTKKPQTDAEKGATDPVGFATKLGISNKPFLMFLRERSWKSVPQFKVAACSIHSCPNSVSFDLFVLFRHKAMKDLKAVLSTRFHNLMELSSG